MNGTLLFLVGMLSDYIGKYLGDKDKGIRLDEHQKYETTLTWEDLVCIDDGEVKEYINLWFEDTLGQRHKVTNSEKLIKQFQKGS